MRPPVVENIYTCLSYLLNYELVCLPSLWLIYQNSSTSHSGAGNSWQDLWFSSLSKEPKLAFAGLIFGPFHILLEGTDVLQQRGCSTTPLHHCTLGFFISGLIPVWLLSQQSSNTVKDIQHQWSHVSHPHFCFRPVQHFDSKRIKNALRCHVFLTTRVQIKCPWMA